MSNYPVIPWLALMSENMVHYELGPISYVSYDIIPDKLIANHHYNGHAYGGRYALRIIKGGYARSQYRKTQNGFRELIIEELKKHKERTDA